LSSFYYRLFFHRAAAAFFAISIRSFLVKAFALAGPPSQLNQSIKTKDYTIKIITDSIMMLNNKILQLSKPNSLPNKFGVSGK
jgi:hypothetical protein